jgi:cytidylate kinase
MWKNINFENVVSYINSSAASETYEKSKGAPDTFTRSRSVSEVKIHPSARPAVTLSRMCGSRGRTVASALAEYLQSHTSSEHRWTIFDKDLIEKVLEDHHLSKRIADFLPEGHKSLFAETIERLRGLHPPTATIVKQTAETVWNLAASGYVILVGRAAAVITEKLDTVFRVRLVGSLEKRIAWVQELYEMGRTDARQFIKSQDAARRSYMKQHFDREIDDPLLYHMIINTDYVSHEMAARLIGDAVITAANRRQAQVSTAS